MDGLNAYITDNPFKDVVEPPRYFNSEGDEVLKRGSYSQQKDRVLTVLKDSGGEWCEEIEIMKAITGLNRREIPDNRYNSIDNSIALLQRDGLLMAEPPERTAHITIMRYGYKLTSAGRRAVTHAKGYKGWLKSNRYGRHGKGYAAKDITEVRT